jgi:hypothetical protein
MTENYRFKLVLAKTVSINSGSGVPVGVTKFGFHTSLRIS